jgi:GWxTD domain-containing protein
MGESAAADGGLMARISTAVLFLALVAPTVVSGQTPLPIDEDWGNSPEAYFLTVEEKQEWRGLQSKESRLGFIERYWLKRDPSPGTSANEFRELVAGRIGTADARYRIEKTPGSRTKRGFVFIVFGTPARFQERRAVPPGPSQRPVAGGSTPPVGLIEGSETVHTWTYDRERTPRLVEALKVPSFSVTFVIEPNRHRDELQNPGLVNEYRDRLAKLTIVNPDLAPPTDAAGGHAPAPARAALMPLSAAARAILEKAPPQGTLETENQAVFGTAVLWGAQATPEALAWVFLPGRKDTSGKLTLHALVRKEGGGEEIFSGSESAGLSEALPSARPGRTVQRRFDLPSGNYTVAFAVTEDGDRPVAAATIPLRVPVIDQGLAVSTIVLSAGVGPPRKEETRSFAFGPVEVLPRADAAFSRSESLWYFVQLANVSDAEKVTQELRLRHGAATVAANPSTPAKLESIGPGRYAFGYEIPLSGLEPGSYVLYLTIRDGEGHSVLRRADFRVLAESLPKSSR